MDELDELIKEFGKNDQISDQRILLYECHFRLGKLTPNIKVRIFYIIGYPESYFYDQSHFIQTPIQVSLYSPSSFASSPRMALNGAIESLQSFYNAAIREGHVPDDNWLVANEDFEE